MTKQHAQKRRGFTLTELAIVLGVMGTILSAIWVASARTTASNKATNSINQIMSIQSAYKSIFFSNKRVDGAWWGNITPMGINGGAFPADMVTTGGAGGAVHNKWGGAVGVFGDSNNNGVIINYAGLPASGCIAVVSGVLSGASNIYQYAVGTPTPSSWPNGADGFAITTTSATINGLCNGAGNTNNVYFFFDMN